MLLFFAGREIVLVLIARVVIKTDTTCWVVVLGVEDVVDVAVFVGEASLFVVVGVVDFHV